jgi:hypothetical protein
MEDQGEEMSLLGLNSRTIKQSDYKGFCCICRYRYKGDMVIKFLDAVGFINIIQCPHCKDINPKSGFQIIHRACAIGSVFSRATCVNCHKEVAIESTIKDECSFGCIKKTTLRFVMELPRLSAKD